MYCGFDSLHPGDVWLRQEEGGVNTEGVGEEGGKKRVKNRHQSEQSQRELVGGEVEVSNP